MTYAQAAATALGDLMRSDARVIALGEDLGRGGVFGQYCGLQAEFGADRIIDTPISEANIMGAAVGMALAGLRPVVEMRVIDFALCAIDELVNQAAKTIFTVDGIDKKTKVGEVLGSFRASRRWRGLVGDAFKLWRAFR